ncbi:MAG: response regulator [Spirochaetota bacterium]
MKSVLAVDDSKMILDLIDMTLSFEDFEVETASNADEAIAKIQKSQYDIGIFDVNMPGKSGLELVPIVKGMANGKSMKIVMLTTESSPELQAKAKASGAKAWVVKPFESENLIKLLNLLSQ